MFTSSRTLRIAAGCATLALGLSAPAATFAAGEPPLKIGIVISYTGPDAVGGQEFDNAIKTFQKLHGDTAGGRKIQFIRRDTGGPSPDVAKRLAQELVVQDKVEILTGINYTPTAIGVDQIATQAKVPTFIMNAATAGILKNAPYSARFGFITSQIAAPFGQWATRNKIKSVYMLFADYAPGIDAAKAFEKSFEAGGGKVLGELKTPIENSDFSSYVQRVKDAKPDALFIFLPMGPTSQQFFKAWTDAGMAKSGIKLIGTGDVTDESHIDALGDAALGMVTTYVYSESHPTKANRDFIKTYQQVNGTKLRPNAWAAFTFDLMTALYKVIDEQHGKIDPQKTIDLLKGMKLNGPRGPLEIDPATRDPIENVYIRRVVKKNGHLWNEEFDTIPMVKPPQTSGG